MKMTSDIETGVYEGIRSMILVFEDGIDVELNQIVEYDIDLDKIEESYIDITNALINTVLLNRFKGAEKNKMIIKHLHIKSEIYNPYDGNKDECFIDIPCNMTIRKVRLTGDVNNITNFEIRLEGCVE